MNRLLLALLASMLLIPNALAWNGFMHYDDYYEPVEPHYSQEVMANPMVYAQTYFKRPTQFLSGPAYIQKNNIRGYVNGLQPYEYHDRNDGYGQADGYVSGYAFPVYASGYSQQDVYDAPYERTYHPQRYGTVYTEGYSTQLTPAYPYTYPYPPNAPLRWVEPYMFDSRFGYIR